MNAGLSNSACDICRATQQRLESPVDGGSESLASHRRQGRAFARKIGRAVMTYFVSDVAFTPSVKAAQQKRGSRENYERMEQRVGWQREITPELVDFIADRDSFYLGTASADGQPCIQHRGGAKGFLKVIDERTLGFADFVGNAQFVSVGNLDENNKAFIFFKEKIR